MPVAAANFAFFFVAGWISLAAAELLTLAALTRLFLRPVPWVASTTGALAFVLLAASSICGIAYVWEMIAAFQGNNPYEGYAFLRSRVAGPATDLLHYVHPAFPRMPWAPYWWAYYLMLTAKFLPQLF